MKGERCFGNKKTDLANAAFSGMFPPTLKQDKKFLASGETRVLWACSRREEMSAQSLPRYGRCLTAVVACSEISHFSEATQIIITQHAHG